MTCQLHEERGLKLGSEGSVSSFKFRVFSSESPARWALLGFVGLCWTLKVLKGPLLNRPSWSIQAQQPSIPIVYHPFPAFLEPKNLWQVPEKNSEKQRLTMNNKQGQIYDARFTIYERLVGAPRP
jgi:hypothetical protein